VILTKVVVEDFNIFYGKQPLELTEGLYVIHGVNGRGKSTFLNAITWALFGEYTDGQGNTVTPKVMLNREAAKEGTTAFGVELHLSDGEDKIRLRRSFDTAKPEAGVKLVVEKNGDMLNQDAGHELLRGLLDRDVSRFFLFDGEELRQYEQLLFGAGDGAAEVRRSIEHILGLPALTNAVEDLHAVAEKFAADATKEMRKEKAARQAALLADQFEKDLEDANDDLAKLHEQLTGYQGEMKAATDLLQEYESSQALITKKVEAEAEIAALAAGREEMAALRKESLKGVWRDVLAVAVKSRRDELAASLGDERAREQWKREADELDRALAAGTCDRCGNSLHGGAEATMRTRLEELRAKPQPSGSITDAVTTLNTLSAIVPSGQTTQAIQQDRSIGKTTSQIASLEQQLKDLTEQIEGVPEAELREASERRDKASERIGVAKEHIGGKEREIGEKKTALGAARDEAKKHSTSQEAALLNKRARMATALAGIFEAAIDKFRDGMRGKVGSDASELFVKLTNEKDLKGLEINENYGLSTLDDAGEPTPGRSADQEQIVAFSLIGALSRNATRKAPIVMDTPLGRLDRAHKENVMTNLADFGEQVILLVHDDEVSEDLLDSVRPSIVAEYELHRESLYKTQLRKREIQ
jgi:DNA sulfur modification protein DndD